MNQNVSLSSSSSSCYLLSSYTAAELSITALFSVDYSAVTAGIDAGSTVIESDNNPKFAFGKKPRPTTKASALMARELSGLTT